MSKARVVKTRAFFYGPRELRIYKRISFPPLLTTKKAPLGAVFITSVFHDIADGLQRFRGLFAFRAYNHF